MVDTVYKWYLKSCCVLQDHYDNERNKIVFYYTTPDLQDQDQDRCFSSQTGLVLRPTVSDHITGLDFGQAGCPSRCPTDRIKAMCLVWFIGVQHTFSINGLHRAIGVRNVLCRAEGKTYTYTQSNNETIH